MSHDLNLRDARAEFLNMFNEHASESVWSGLTLEVQAEAGYAKLAAITRNPIFKEFTGELKPEGLDTAALTYETKVYKAGLEIPRKVFDHATSLMKTEYGREVLNVAADAIDNRDNLLTELLEANGTDITGSAFFGTAKAIWNSTQTINNLVTGTGTSSSQIQTDFWSGLTLLMKMKNASGRPYHGGKIGKAGVTIMYPPDLESAMQNAFAAARLSSGADNILFNRAKLRVNPFLTVTNDWYIFVDNARYPAFALGVAQDPTSEQDTDPNSRDVIIHETYLFAARDEVVAMYGQPMSCVKINNT